MEQGWEREDKKSRVLRGAPFGLRFCVCVPNEILSLPRLRSRGTGPYLMLIFFLLFNLNCMELKCLSSSRVDSWEHGDL
jgi:hypothetical protein